MTTPSTVSEEDEVARPVALLQRQADLISKLGTLSERQSGLVDEGQGEDLLTLLGQRQQLIDALDAINTDLEPFQARWSQLWEGLGESDRQRIGPLVSQTQQVLDQIMATDDRDQERLRVNQQRIAEELGRVNQTGEARRAYTAGAPNPPNRFTDKQG